MQKPKKFWSKLKYWQKGMMIGAIIGFLYGYFSLILLSFALSLPLFLNRFFLPLNMITFGIYFEIGYSYLILTIVIGSTIGLIISKLNKK